MPCLHASRMKSPLLLQVAFCLFSSSNSLILAPPSPLHTPVLWTTCQSLPVAEKARSQGHNGSPSLCVQRTAEVMTLPA